MPITVTMECKFMELKSKVSLLFEMLEDFPIGDITIIVDTRDKAGEDR